MSDHEFEKRQSFSHWGGRASGIEGAASLAMKEAADLFMSGKDDQAEMMRAFARKLTENAKEARIEQRKYA